MKKIARDLARQASNRLSSLRHDYAYSNYLAQLPKTQPTAPLAVIIHLYYLETWPALYEQLQNITIPYDLFVTIPETKPEHALVVVRDIPEAKVIKVPNRGRDVLPFVKIASILDSLGYEYFLKLHSKKSPHQDFLNTWMDELTTSLLPDNPKVMNQIIEQLAKTTTGIVGPSGHYLSLPVNYAANRSQILQLLEKIQGNQDKLKVDTQPSNYGFFAGTMFWARFDAIRPIITSQLASNMFDPEAGQIDGTLAHAIERILCLVPELNHKKLYEVSESALIEIEYKTNNIPEWSELHPTNQV